MSQKRIQDYGSPVVAMSLKALAGAVTSQGVLYGNEFIKDSTDRMRINPGACVTHQGVIIVEDEAKLLTIENSTSASDWTIYYSHEDEDISGGVVAELVKESGLLTNDVVKGCILGYVRYPGGVQLDQTHFIQPAELKIGTLVPTKENAQWVMPIRNQGYCVTYTSGSTINITDGGAGTFSSISITGTTIESSNIIQDILTTSGLLAGMTVIGTNIVIGSVIVSVDSTNQITISNAATATASSVSLSVFATKPILYLKLANNGLSSGVTYLTFPFKVSANPFALLQMIISTDNSAVIVPVFYDSGGSMYILDAGFTGQSDFLLKTAEIPRTAIQTANSIVYLQLQVSLASTKEARIQAVGLNTYNLPI